jgi:hypothetical protein
VTAKSTLDMTKAMRTAIWKYSSRPDVFSIDMKAFRSWMPEISTMEPRSFSFSPVKSLPLAP